MYGDQAEDFELLWSGAYHMKASQDIPLSKPISSFKHGAIIVFSKYTSDVVRDYAWSFHFIPRYHIIMHPGTGINLTMLSVDDNSAGIKYLYVYDDHIKGNDKNATEITFSGSGFKISPEKYVMRYVLGF